MHDAISVMLEKYDCQNLDDYTNALKEIIQEIALLGLWRIKFFEHAAFYGGTALRILYGLNRFSEDLDFSLIEPNPHFDLNIYNNAVKKELEAFGFELEVVSKPKLKTQIVSTFIKADTKIQFLNLKVPDRISNYLPRDQKLSIKMEVDTDPPPLFDTENKPLLQPIPFSVNTYTLPDAFAGKIHAMLCRNWKSRVKGRDWYDFIWFMSRKTPVRLSHLKQRLVQTEHWKSSKAFTEKDLINMMNERIEQLDIEKAKEDVRVFLKDPDSTRIWSNVFFLNQAKNLKVI
ncbi:MAG: nucleotidyl transferase AbiEii/AbiGii toxin family protein [Candidatus Berkiella sp.]